MGKDAYEKLITIFANNNLENCESEILNLLDEELEIELAAPIYALAYEKGFSKGLELAAQRSLTPDGFNKYFLDLLLSFCKPPAQKAVFRAILKLKINNGVLEFRAHARALANLFKTDRNFREFEGLVKEEAVSLWVQKRKLSTMVRPSESLEGKAEEIHNDVFSKVHRVKETAVKSAETIITTITLVEEVYNLQNLRLGSHAVNFTAFCLQGAGVDLHVKMFMKYVPGGNLRTAIYKEETYKRQPLTELEKLHIMQKLALAFHFLHKENILHRDIKPQNILLTETRDPVIADFGASTVLNGGKRIEVNSTTIPFAPIQSLLGDLAYDKKLNDKMMEGYRKLLGMQNQTVDPLEEFSVRPALDVYSLGLLFWELLWANGYPYKDAEIFVAVEKEGELEIQKIKAIEDAATMSHFILENKPTFAAPTQFGAPCAALMTNMWHHDWRKRPSMKEVAEQTLKTKIAYQARLPEQQPPKSPGPRCSIQ